MGFLLNVAVFVIPIIEDPVAAAIGLGFFVGGLGKLSF